MNIQERFEKDMVELKVLSIVLDYMDKSYTEVRQFLKKSANIPRHLSVYLKES
jgi:hypothetical protein